MFTCDILTNDCTLDFSSYSVCITSSFFVKPQMLRDAGFEEVTAEDRTGQVCRSGWLYHVWNSIDVAYWYKLFFFFFLCFQFIEVLQRELNVVEKEKYEFISDFSEVGFFPHLSCFIDRSLSLYVPIFLICSFSGYWISYRRTTTI